MNTMKLPMLRSSAIAFSASLFACVSTPPPNNPGVTVATQTTVIANEPPNDSPGDVVNAAATAHAGSSIVVITDKHLPRPTELIAVLDFHSDATSEDKGFDELRARAAAMGADAVIGAEFEHGEGQEPSHLSGMVVRYLDR